MSGVGKGIATSSIGTLLQAYGYETNLVKVDPYLNVDAGTMNPTEHGEVFVLNSGLETDQDMGNYERFLNRDLTHEDYMTSGMIYYDVIKKERSLGYKGKCIEAIPDIRDEIIRRMEHGARISKSDISVIEIGGTVGDYQNIMFIEAARVLKLKNPNDVLFILVSYLPIPNKIGEMKTRPTQNAVRSLNSYGVQPDIIIARSTLALDQKRKEKIAISCNVLPQNVISAPDIDSIYDVPINFEKDKLAEILLGLLHLKQKKNVDGSDRRADRLAEWKNFVSRVKNAKKDISIAVIGKYFDTGDFVLSDSYLSVIEAIKFSAYHLGVKAKLTWINSKNFEKNEKGKVVEKVSILKKFDAIIVPGGFGESGIEGIIQCIKFARENNIPYLGLCYGMQLMVIEYARHVAGLSDANTAEINAKSPHLVIDIMPDQKKKLAEGNYGASMRLGAYKAHVKEGTVAQKAYSKVGAQKSQNGKNENQNESRAGVMAKGKMAESKGSKGLMGALSGVVISERHRHRYEVNPVYIERIEKAGLVFSATSPDGTLMEIAELPKSKHPFFLGTQFHPEFQARPLAPHPLFTEFISATIKRKIK